ncbi:MAG: MarR family winged helix-turn-helix transcriptional regulator [Actinomycetota bacterium]
MTPAERTDTAMRAWTRLLEIIQRTARSAEQDMSDSGITPAQFLVLATIDGNGPQRQTDLAKRLRVTEASVSQTVSRMEANGHVERRADGRANLIDLTAVGRALHEAVKPQHRAHIARQFEPLDDNHLAQLALLLEQLVTVPSKE